MSGNDKKTECSSQENRAHVKRSLITSAAIFCTIFLVGVYLLPAGKYQEFPSQLEHIVYTLRWQSIPVLTLLFGINRVGNKRFSTIAIDPVSGGGEHLLAIEARYLQNTLEQLIVSVSGQVILSTYLSASTITRVIPMLVVLFVTGRVLFYIGYKMHPLKRAIGFSMTFLPSVAVHTYCVFCFLYYR